MAAPLTPVDGHLWRNTLFLRLQNRNRAENHAFKDLLSFHNRLFESSNALRAENLQLSIQNERLKSEQRDFVEKASGDGGSNSSGKSPSHKNEKFQNLEQKLFSLQEELTEMHRRKGENAQQLVDLNKKLQEKEKQLQLKEASLAEYIADNSSLKAEIQMYKSSMQELESLNQIIRDEYNANQLALTALEEKLRKTQDENRQLVERLVLYKSRDADRMNEDNENFLRKKQAKVQRELEDAAKESRAVSPESAYGGDRSDLGATPFFASNVPSKAISKFEAHDQEINAVKWSTLERLVATGGADRKVKLWDISKGGQHESRGVLVGSNAAVMSIDFDSTGTLILGASNDFATRVWTVADHRLRHTLTGHSGKVMAAKFLEQSKVVTGSHDRTLKIWDLRSRACIETKFAGSSCNDLVTGDGSGTTIISGHFDKRIRFWDSRTDASSVNDIVLQGKITSLDLSRDGKYLLSCVRDDSLKMLDLRMNTIVCSFTADGFKVGCDFTRAAFSPDAHYIAVGSADGAVFVWNVESNKVEHILKEHQTAVTAVSWHPYGSFLLSVDRAKTAVVWGDA